MLDLEESMTALDLGTCKRKRMKENSSLKFLDNHYLGAWGSLYALHIDFHGASCQSEGPVGLELCLLVGESFTTGENVWFFLDFSSDIAGGQIETRYVQYRWLLSFGT